MFANKAGQDAFFSDGHLVPEDRLLMLSDGVGDVTAVDLRTNTQARRRRACLECMYVSWGGVWFMRTELNKANERAWFSQLWVHANHFAGMYVVFCCFCIDKMCVSCSLIPCLSLSWQVWKREAHEKKANTVHTHPTNSHLFVTVSRMACL